MPQRFETHFAGLENRQLAFGRAERAAVPERAAAGRAQPKGGERAAVVEVHADPVPTLGVGVQQFFAPLMVQPSLARDIESLPLQGDLAAGVQLRVAVVVAGLTRFWPFARQAVLALQNQRLGFIHLQLQREVVARQSGVVAAGLSRVAL